jgi:hypothetical protein
MKYENMNEWDCVAVWGSLATHNNMWSKVVSAMQTNVTGAFV